MSHRFSISPATRRTRSTEYVGTKAPFFIGTLIVAAVLIAPSTATAAFINFYTTAPITHTTNLTNTTFTADSLTANFFGVNTPAVSTNPVPFTKKSAGLFVPGTGGTMVSDFVLFDATLQSDNGTPSIPADDFQNITIEFHTGDILLSTLQTTYSAYVWAGGIDRDGTLQDLHGFLGTYPIGGLEGLFVRVQSSESLEAAGAPEPGALAIAGVGILLMGFAAWRYRRSR